MLGCDVATDRPAPGRFVVVGRGERHHQHLAGDVGDHQPVGWWFGWVEQRVGVPDFVDVVDAVGVVFEEVGGLSVDLDGSASSNRSRSNNSPITRSVLQTDTNVEQLRRAVQPGRVAPAMKVDTMYVACRSRLRLARS